MSTTERTYTTCAEDATKIRERLKLLGFGRKDVSVRSHTYSMGSSIRVEILSARLPFFLAKEEAEKVEHVRRDQRGEILSGGNRFVFVERSRGCREEIGKLYPGTEMLRDAIERVKAAPKYQGVHVDPQGVGRMAHLVLFRGQAGWDFQVVDMESDWRSHYSDSPEGLAVDVFDFLGTETQGKGGPTI